MKKSSGLLALLALLSALATDARSSEAHAADVLTHRYNNMRSGVNPKETKLNPSTVNNNLFGKLAFRNVDGDIYAQPLVVSQARIINRPKPVNVVIVATEHNSVWAFDADDMAPEPLTQLTHKALWQRGPEPAPDGSPGLGASVPSEDLYRRIGAGDDCADITPEIGITSTPVIKIMQNTSPKRGIIFVVAKSIIGAQIAYRLFALNLFDGKSLGSGVPIEGTVNGPGKTISFDALVQLNRPALLLDGNTLYVAFGSHCDGGNYRGWVFAYDVSNPSAPRMMDAFATTFTTPAAKGECGQGGIWMSGYGLATDGDSVYFSTGNGVYNATNAHYPELSDSVVKIKLVAGKFQLQDWFSPSNRDLLAAFDADLGSAGPVIVPDSHLLIAGGKEGRFYLIDRNDMGRGGKDPLQSFQVTHAPRLRIPNPKTIDDIQLWNIHGAPVIWPFHGGMFVYVMGEEDHLKQYKLVPDSGAGGWKFDAGFQKMSPEAAALPPPNLFDDLARKVNMPGGFLTISANRSDTSTGIVWATMPLDNANEMVVRGVLRAFDASDVSKGQIWSSEDTGNPKDSLGFFAKFNPPVVLNGKVYVATFQQEHVEGGRHFKAEGGLLPALVIYGLKRPRM